MSETTIWPLHLFYLHSGCFSHRCHGDRWWWEGHCDPDDTSVIWLRLHLDQISTPEVKININQKIDSTTDWLTPPPLCLPPPHLDSVIGSVSDQQRLSLEECGSRNSCSMGVSLLVDQLTAFQVPECNVSLRTARRQNGRSICGEDTSTGDDHTCFWPMRWSDWMAWFLPVLKASVLIGPQSCVKLISVSFSRMLWTMMRPVAVPTPTTSTAGL